MTIENSLYFCLQSSQTNLMRVTLTFLLGIAMLVSCRSVDNKDSVIKEQQKKIAELEGKLAVPVPIETEKTVLDTPVARNKSKELHFPAGMFQTYPQIIKYIFGAGSTTEEVRIILGRPEYSENKTEPVPNTGIQDRIETWYYGKMIVYFRNGVVTTVSNPANNPHCLSTYNIDFRDLLISDIYIEKQFGLHLLENMRKADNPFGL